MVEQSEVIVRDLGELEALCLRLLEEGCRHFALYGDLGTGKTAFVKLAGKLLGITGPVQSPTFTILLEYALPGDEWFYHFDLYRLGTAEEALDLGFEEYWESDQYVFIEWPELVKDELPSGYLHLYFYHIDENTRRVAIPR